MKWNDIDCGEITDLCKIRKIGTQKLCLISYLLSNSGAIKNQSMHLALKSV